MELELGSRQRREHEGWRVNGREPVGTAQGMVSGTVGVAAVAFGPGSCVLW